MAELKFTIVGGGLAGALTACYLGKAGYEVDVFELRDDLRTSEIGRGRSINLALSYRGLCALEPVGLVDEVLRQAVPMRGRMIHARTGETHFQPYGVDDTQAINSVSRGGLNAILLSAAERYSTVRLHFGQKCVDVNVDVAEVEFQNTNTGELRRVRSDVVLSADGAFSALRKALQRRERFNYSQEYLEHGYKELTIPAATGSYVEPGFQLEKNALHIWPRRAFMMIALPNADGSFTCTLFWPWEGPNSFAAIETESDLLAFFNDQFPDAVPLMPDLVADYFGNPTGSLVTIRCSPWHVDDRVVLLGDAAHAVVPFYGQGMNAAFEDVLVLDECLRKYVERDGEGNVEIPARRDQNDERKASKEAGDIPARENQSNEMTPSTKSADRQITRYAGLRQAFAEFEAARKPNADALANLAIGNFIEMRDRTGSRWFLLKKKGEKLLARLLPGWYLPLYSMVTFSRIPYAAAVRRARKQSVVVKWAGAALLLGAIIGTIAAW